MLIGLSLYYFFVYGAPVCPQHTGRRRCEVEARQTPADGDLGGVAGVEEFNTLDLLGVQR